MLKGGGRLIKAKFVLILVTLTMLCAPAFGQTTAKDWIHKGVDLYGLGSYNETIQAFDRAIEIDPQYADAWSRKGIVLSRLGKYDEALRAFNKSIEMYVFSSHLVFKI